MVSANLVLILWILIGSVVTILLGIKSYENINVKYVMITWHTEKGKGFIEWISKYKIWNYIGNLGVVLISITGVIFSLLLFLSTYAALVTDTKSTIQSPKNFLIIPGVNDFLPVNETIPIIIALAIAILVHEFGHGIFCRFNNIEIESLGFVLISFLPMGAFVKPNEESQENAHLKGKLQMVSAGIMNNFILFLVSLILLFSVATYLIVPMSGGFVDTVYPNSSAEEAGLSNEMVITSINGDDIKNTEEMIEKMKSSGANLTLTDSDNTKYNITKSLQVISSPGQLKPKDEIKYINNKKVLTKSQYREIASENRVLNITLENGENKRIWSGVYSFNKTSNMTILQVNNNRVINSEDMDKYKDTVNITYVKNNKIKKSNINISDYKFAKGYSGITFSEVGVTAMNLNNYHSLLNGSRGVLKGGVYTMFGPFTNLGKDGFAGFIDNINFYKSTTMIPKNIMALLASVFFWSAFVNINLMFVNSLPVPALDGGHALRYFSQYILGKSYDNDDKIEKASRKIEVFVGLSLVISFAVILFLI